MKSVSEFSRFSKLLTLILVCTVATSYFGEIASGKASKTYFVGFFPKSLHTPFLMRMATAKQHLLITANRIAPHQRAVIIAGDSVLYVVELQRPKGEVVPELYRGEVYREKGFAFVRIPSDPRKVAAEDYIEDPKAFVMRVGDVAISVDRKARLPVTFGKFSKRDISIPKGFLEQKLAQFTGAEPFFVEGTEYLIRERGSDSGKETARIFLNNEFLALGYRVDTHPYSGFYSGVNFIAERSGQDPSKTLLISAHYDSVNNAGADDDASGVISGLAMAKALEAYDLKYNLRVVGFDQEESGLVGSGKYAAHLLQTGGLEQVIGVINLEMTAFDGDQDFAIHVIDCNENTSGNLTAAFLQGIAAEELPLTRVEACTNRSDHASFWRYDVPAIVVSQNFFGGDSNPCYHRSCDQVDQLHFDYMKKITQGLTATVLNILAVDD